MIARVLDPSEWDRLDTDVTRIGLRSDRHRVVVVEDEGKIVARCVLMQATHGEFAWIAPEHRKRGAVARRLREAVMQESAAMGPTIWLSACSDEMRSIVPRLGAKLLPGVHYVLNLSEATCRPL